MYLVLWAFTSSPISLAAAAKASAFFYAISTSKEFVNVHANFVCNRINIPPSVKFTRQLWCETHGWHTFTLCTFCRLHKNATLFDTTFKQNSTFIAAQKAHHTTQSSSKWSAVSIYEKLVISQVVEKFLASCRGHVAMNEMRRWICMWLRKDGICIGTRAQARLVIHNIITTNDTPYLNNTGQNSFHISLSVWVLILLKGLQCQIFSVTSYVCMCVKVGQPF